MPEQEPEPEFPAEMFEDTQSPAYFRCVSEWLFAHNTTPETRAIIRDRAADHRDELINVDIDPSDEATEEAMWQGWYVAGCNWTPYLMSELEGAESYALRAMQFSGMVLLLTTDPNVPDPPTPTTESVPA